MGLSPIPSQELTDSRASWKCIDFYNIITFVLWMIVSYSGGCYSNKHSVWTPTLTVSLITEIAARTVGKAAYTVWTCCSKGWLTCLRGQCETLSHYSEQRGTKILKVDYFRNCPFNMLKTQLNAVTKIMGNGESHCVFLVILLLSVLTLP